MKLSLSPVPFLAVATIPVAIARPDWRDAVFLIGVTLFLVAFRHPTRRWMKYDGALLCGWSLCFGQALGEVWKDAAPARALQLAVPLWLPALTALGYYLIARPRSPLGLARVLYRLTHGAFGSLGSVPFFLLLIWTPYAAAFYVFFFGIARYMSSRRLESWPILYLRKFHSNHAVEVFHELLAPVVSKAHVLVGLTTLQDHPALVKHRFRFTPAYLYAVADSDWQNWIEQRINCCAGVILDMRAGSANLDWELARAKAALPQQSVLTLTSTQEQDVPGTTTLCVGDRDKKVTQAFLRTWIDSAAGQVPAR